MATSESRRIVVTLAEQVSEGADAARVAGHVVAVWQQIEDALTPVIGPRGVAALYKRSLYLIAPEHTWLARLQEDVDPPAVDTAALRAALAQQDPAAAAAGGGALLQTFHELLASLIGASLTERLLATAWALPTSGPSAQDTSS